MLVASCELRVAGGCGHSAKGFECGIRKVEVGMYWVQGTRQRALSIQYRASSIKNRSKKMKVRKQKNEDRKMSSDNLGT